MTIQRIKQWIKKDESLQPTLNWNVMEEKLYCVYVGITTLLFILSI